MSLLFEQFLKGHLLGLFLFERLHALAVGVSGVRLRQFAVFWIVAAAKKKANIVTKYVLKKFIIPTQLTTSSSRASPGGGPSFRATRPQGWATFAAGPGLQCRMSDRGGT